MVGRPLFPNPVVEESPVILEQPRLSASNNLLKARETHFRRRRLQIQHSISYHFTHHWSMFETVARASANDPNVFRFGMAIQNKIVVRGVFILANPCLKQRGARHFWKTHAQIGACRRQFVLRDLTLHRAGINDRSTRVVGDLEAAPVVSRYPKERILAHINPGWQLLFCEAQIPRRCAENETFLPSGNDGRRQEWEDFPEPWATRAGHAQRSLQKKGS